MNTKLRRCSLVKLGPSPTTLVSFDQCYEMVSPYTDPTTNIEYDRIVIIFDTDGPFEELDTTSNPPLQLLVGGIERHPNLTFKRSSTSYSPGLDDAIMRHAARLGTFEPRVLKRLKKVSFVHTYQAFRPRPSIVGG